MLDNIVFMLALSFAVKLGPEMDLYDQYEAKREKKFLQSQHFPPPLWRWV